MRLANRLVGNTSECAALEITATGPTLKFGFSGVLALAGAPMKAKLDGKPIEFWQTIEFSGGSVLQIGALEGDGQRAYLALRGGFDVPIYMGSRATFTLGQFGGHVGRNLRVGDILHVGIGRKGDSQVAIAAMPELSRPNYSAHWDIAVLYGPHSAPDFFTAEDIETFFQTDWRVHYNSSRTGVRLIGPKPQWARRDGGEAGLHPSNIHDNAYAIGAIDFTGDMPVILGPDGPSLGGFVCPATVALSDQWKLGQLRPGNTIRFHAISASTARDLLKRQDQSIEKLQRVGAVAEHLTIASFSCVRFLKGRPLMVRARKSVIDSQVKITFSLNTASRISTSPCGFASRHFSMPSTRGNCLA